MRVLVTGHQGYLGSVLVPWLRAAGFDVIGMDVGLFADCTLGPVDDAVENRPVDLRDVRPEDCAGVDAVVHLAGLCNDPLGDLNPALTYAVNHQATLRLARAAKTAGVRRFVLSSSCSLYGAGVGDGLLTEEAPFAPVTPYGEAKVLAERDLLALAGDGFSPVFARNATAYGFSPRLRGDLVVNDLVAHALLTGEVRLRSDGTAWRPLVHVDDIAAAFAALLAAPVEVVHARAFNVGRSTENYLIREVAELVAQLVPGSTVTFAGGASADRRNYRVSCDRIIAEVPGFRPQWSVGDGVEQLLGEYRRHGLRLEDLTGERHQRLKRIRALQDAGRLTGELRWAPQHQDLNLVA